MAPPAPAKPDPILRLDLPVLRIGEQALRELTKTGPSAVAAAPSRRISTASTTELDRSSQAAKELIARYRKQPTTIQFSEDVTKLFSAMPQHVHCAVSHVRRFASPDELRHSPTWVDELASLVLSPAELASFQVRQQSPMARTSSLLGRIAGKDAVRMFLQASETPLRELEWSSATSGRCRVETAAGQKVTMSLDHAGLHAAAIAADAEAYLGVGIGVEPFRPLDPSLIEDAFDNQERRLLEEVAASRAEAAELWYLSAWAAKEAIGRALGTGVLSPRNVAIQRIEPQTGQLSVTVSSAILEAAQPSAAYQSLSGQLIDCYLARASGCVMATCPISRQPLNGVL